MLQVIRHGKGTCFWCSHETEDGAEVQTGGSKLFLCKRDFWSFLKNRSKGNESVPARKSPAPPGNER